MVSVAPIIHNYTSIGTDIAVMKVGTGNAQTFMHIDRSLRVEESKMTGLVKNVSKATVQNDTHEAK